MLEKVKGKCSNFTETTIEQMTTEGPYENKEFLYLLDGSSPLPKELVEGKPREVFPAHSHMGIVILP